jgi:MinD superfamily P-loop ATPase
VTGQRFTIAVVSGKGGTGKTTIATSLALATGADRIVLLDCDVEAPNAHIFLKPSIQQSRLATIPTPELRPDRCDSCGRCAEVCRFHAVVCIGVETLIFPELCHGCGSCVLQCPNDALVEVDREIGVLESGSVTPGLVMAHGRLNIGEPMPVPVIRQLKSWQVFAGPEIEIRDAPPGTSCSVVETLRGADIALLVTEPTPFGLHDLRLSVELVRKLGLPMGVVINRSTGCTENQVQRFCMDEQVPILLEIPFRREIAAALAGGESLVIAFPDFMPRFSELYQALLHLSTNGSAINKDESVIEMHGGPKP